MSNQITEARLMEAISRSSAPHAILICGPEGSDANDMARRAAAMCCTGSPDPVGLLTYPDYYALGPRAIGVNQVRELQTKLNARPLRPWRAVNIFDAQRMTHEAQNALLKTLEEPPEQTLLLLSGREEGLLPTVRSRCTTLRLGMQPPQLLLDALLEEGMVPGHARLAAVLSDGLPELGREFSTTEFREFRLEAAGLLEKVLGRAPNPPYAALKQQLERFPGPVDGVELTPTEMQRTAARVLVEIWISLCRDALRTLLIEREPVNHDRNLQVRDMAKSFTIARIQSIIEMLAAAQVRLSTANPGLTMDRLVTDLMELKMTGEPCE